MMDLNLHTSQQQLPLRVSNNELSTDQLFLSGNQIKQLTKSYTEQRFQSTISENSQSKIVNQGLAFGSVYFKQQEINDVNSQDNCRFTMLTSDQKNIYPNQLDQLEEEQEEYTLNAKQIAESKFQNQQKEQSDQYLIQIDMNNEQVYYDSNDYQDFRESSMRQGKKFSKLDFTSLQRSSSNGYNDDDNLNLTRINIYDYYNP